MSSSPEKATCGEDNQKAAFSSGEGDHWLSSPVKKTSIAGFFYFNLKSRQIDWLFQVLLAEKCHLFVISQMVIAAHCWDLVAYAGYTFAECVWLSWEGYLRPIPYYSYCMDLFMGMGIFFGEDSKESLSSLDMILEASLPSAFYRPLALFPCFCIVIMSEASGLAADTVCIKSIVLKNLMPVRDRSLLMAELLARKVNCCPATNSYLAENGDLSELTSPPSAGQKRQRKIFRKQKPALNVVSGSQVSDPRDVRTPPVPSPSRSITDILPLGLVLMGVIHRTPKKSGVPLASQRSKFKVQLLRNEVAGLGISDQSSL
nr:hypothetical protein Iba_chr06bCG10740 [Ipomoea batatas]